MPETPLTPDEARSAAASIAGYAYQIWFSLLALLELKDDDALVLEGAEDIDLLKKGDIQAWQVRHTEASITLGGEYARKAIQNFFRMRASNAGRPIRYKYVTTSNIGTEADEPFGKGIKGIELWQKSSKTIAEIKLLRKFLLAQALDEPTKVIIRGLSDAELETTLFQGLEWDAGQLPAEGIRRRVENKLLTIARSQGVIASQVSGLADQLFVYLLGLAASKDRQVLQVLDLMTKLEEITRRSIPLTEYRELESLRQMIGSIVPVQNPVPVSTINPAFGSRPPLLGILIARQELQDRIRAGLAQKDLIYLQGSSGMGKTILANQASPANDVLWTTFRASVPGRPSATAPLLDSISTQIEAGNIFSSIVLDDLDFSPEKFTNYKDSLAAVIFSAKTRGIKILVTGQKPLPSTFTALFGAVVFESITIPRFTREEIQAVLQAFGCLPDMAKKWSYLVELTSLGHPQLVHARVIELADRGLKDPTEADFLSASPGVDETKKEAALLLSARDAVSTQILGRLSLFLGGFRRDQAIKVMEDISGITLPGQQFDKLIGPWIEPIDKDYFQVSPLLSGLGNTLWSAQETRRIREDIGISIVACGKLTLTEAENLIAQSVFSASDNLLQMVLPNLITLPLEGRKALASTVTWVTALDRNAVGFKQKASRLLLLNLQFVVALEARHELVPKLLADIRALPDTSSNKLMKIWTYGQLLFNEKFASVALRLEVLVEMVALQRSAWDDKESEETANFARITDAPEMGGLSYEYGLFGNILFQCKTLADVRSLVEFLKGNPGGMELMKRCLEQDAYLAFSLVQKIWLTEETKSQPDWASVLQLLAEIETFGRENQLPIFIEASLCSQMVVLIDYLKDETAAQAVFDRSFTAVAGPTAYLLNGRAKLLAHQRKWREASAIWDQINPIVPTASSRLLPLVSMQEAAVTASNFDGQKAVQIYLAAEKYAEEIKPDEMVLRTGLLADAALLLWRADRVGEAVELLTKVLENLEGLPNTPDELRSFKLRKCVGQLLLNLAYQESPALNPTVYRTPFGFCSSFETPPGFQNLPVGQSEYLWVFLYNLSWLKPFPVEAKQALEGRLRNLYSPLARVLFFQRLIEFSLRDRDFADFSQLVQEYGTATIIAKAHRDNPAAPITPQSFAPVVSLVIDDIVALTLDAAFAARWLSGKPEWDVAIEAFEHSANGLPIAEAVRNRIASFRRLFGSDLSDLEQTVFTAPEFRTRLDAALLVLARGTSTPEHLLRATLIIILNFERNAFRVAVSGHIVSALTTLWLKVCDQQRALLLAPTINVPALRDACNSNLTGLQKTSCIALAAIDAVGMQLDPSILAALRKLATTPLAD